MAEWFPLCSISAAYAHSPDSLTFILWISAFMARISVCPVSESTEARISFASWIFFSQSMIWCLQRQERQCQGRSSLSWSGRDPTTTSAQGCGKRSQKVFNSGSLQNGLSSLETDRQTSAYGLAGRRGRRGEREREEEGKGKIKRGRDERRAGETAQRLRTLPALAEGLNSVPSTLVVSYPDCNSGFRGILEREMGRQQGNTTEELRMYM